MKNIALVAAIALASTTASIRPAAACGGGGQSPPALGIVRAESASPRTAVGVWPRLEKKNGITVLSLSYPQFDGAPVQLYMDRFVVVRDRNLRRLEHVLAHTEWPNLDVSIERVDATRWRVTGWTTHAS